MKNGRYTIRSGFSTASNPIAPRRYSLDNGDYKKNMRITDLRILPGVDPGQTDMGNSSILLVVAMTEAGATPLDGTTDFHQGYQFRFDDGSQIAWASAETTVGLHVVIDPDHIIPGDIYVNAWCISTGGSPTTLVAPINYLIEMQQYDETGAEGLLSRIKETMV